MRIEIIATDVSKFSETGFGGIESCKNFFLATKRKYPETNFNIVEDVKDLQMIADSNPDFVVFGFKYLMIAEKKFWLSDFFSESGINFLGSTRESIEYDSDKVKAKEEVAKKGIKTAQYFVVAPEDIASKEHLSMNYPLFVKPVDAACSFGVDSRSLVSNYHELKNKVSEIYELFNQPSLVEEFLPGKEFTVVVVGNGSNLDAIPIELESIFNIDGNKFLPREVKVANIENAKCIEDEEFKEKICAMAKSVFTCLKARDFARVDIKLDSKGTPCFLEINMMPGFTKGRSYFPIAFEKNRALSYDDTILHVLQIGLKRINQE